MDIGVPREVRDLEKRVGLVPAAVLTLTEAGHTVYIERGAGEGAGFPDEAYRKVGGQIVYNAAEAYGRAEIVAKVTRPTAEEHVHFRYGQAIFSFFHLPTSSPDLLEALIEHQITAVSYEMIERTDGVRPVLRPASIVAGQMTPLIAGQLLRSDQGGKGILLSGLPGVPAAAVVIVGAGTLGRHAAKAFAGVGAEVTVLDKDPCRLQLIYDWANGRITTMFSNNHNLKRAVQFADVLVGAVSTSGQRAPMVISREMVRTMRAGAILIDFSIDEGGCVETSRPTTLRNPTYWAENVIHHCVPNMTSAYGRTTSYAISNAALPYLLDVAQTGWSEILTQKQELARGVILYEGKISNPSIASALGRTLEYTI
jgi:alanine dehydrogenase